MATSPWIFVTGRRWGKLASLRQFPIFFPPAYKNPRRHQGQERQKKKANPSRGRPLSFWLASRWFGSLPLTFPALCGALNFCERAEKGRRLFERSEFASFPARSRKFKESFAASGAPFFAYFLWQDKESESVPAGNEREVDHPVQSLAENAIRESGAHEQPNSQDDADDNNKAAQHLLRQPVQQPRPSKPACDAANAQGQHRRPVHLRRERKYRHG